MKLLVPMMIAAVLFTACAGQPRQTSTSGPANANSAPSATAASPDAKPANAEPAANRTIAAAPVEFTYVGITPDKENFSYKVKVNTAKPISQVDIATKYYDDKGKVIGDTTIAWQNVVKSTRQPIEAGKTYAATGHLEPGSSKVEAGLKRVVFTDGSTWSAQ